MRFGEELFNIDHSHFILGVNEDVAVIIIFCKCEAVVEGVKQTW